jgi:hypothetical protein
MPDTKQEKIFVDGLFSDDIPDITPDFVLGKGSLDVDRLINFLIAHKKYAVKGYLDYTILRSKASGKRYAELNLWKFNNPKPSLDDNFKNF